MTEEDMQAFIGKRWRSSRCNREGTQCRAQRAEQLTPLQNAIYLLKQTQARLAAYERAQSEPIAVIGMGCRFPGGAEQPRRPSGGSCATASTPSRSPGRPLEHRRLLRSRSHGARQDEHPLGRISQERGRVRRRVLRHLAARGGSRRSAAPPALGGRLGSLGRRGPARQPRSPRPRPASTSA